LRPQNELLCSYIYFLCSNFLLLCLDMGVIYTPFLKKTFFLGKGWGFWGFNNKPP
jgi:hypothetical protein